MVGECEFCDNFAKCRDQGMCDLGELPMSELYGLTVQGRKVIVSRQAVALFNAQWANAMADYLRERR